jgi:hypothetical protein
MAESSVIDLRDRNNPPPDDSINAPYGYRWDSKAHEWLVKKSAGGRKAGSAWWGKKNDDDFLQDIDTPSAPSTRFDDQDPEPSYAQSTSKAVKTPPKVTKKTKDDMTAAVGLVGMLVLPPVVNADPYCGQVLTDNFQNIADALLPLLCKSETVVGFFTDTGSDWMLWFKLAMAFAPVAMAVGRHHITKTVEIQQDEETGELYAVPRDFSEYNTD